MPLFALLLMLVSLSSSEVLGDSAHLFKSTKEILDLPRPVAALGYPVELTGVVTLLIPGEPQLFVQDSAGGISVMPRAVQGIKAGDVVLIEGKTAAGRFAPVIGEAHLTRLRHSALPKPLRISVDEFRPSVEGRYIEFEATVRSVFRVNERFQVNLSHDGQAVTARVYDTSEAGMPHPGDVIRARGIASSIFNSKGQWLGPRLIIQNFAAMEVICSGDRDDRKLPLGRIGDLFTYSGSALGSDQVRVRGVVTCVEADGIICIQDGADGLIARTGIKQQVALNDVIEVVGFPSFDSYSPTLKDAVVRKTYESHSVSPVATSAASAETGKHDGRLVEMTGIVVLRQRLQKKVRGQVFDQWFLTLRDGEHSFTAELTDTLQEDDRRIAPGSKVRVTGVCHVVGPPSMGLVQPYKLWMRSPADLAVIEAASWWTRERAMAAVVGLGAAVSLGLIWLSVLRRKVRRQTSIIRGQIQLETALAERYRDLFENSTDLVFTVDINGCFQAMNQAAKQTFGCLDGDTCVWTLRDLLSPEEIPVLQDILGLLIGGERSVLRQMPIVTLNNNRVVLEMNCRLRHGPDGPNAVEIIARDVTQQKREQAALEEARSAAESASRSKSEFLANMSHEIRTPMNGILGMTELTLESKLDHDQRTNLEVVKTSAESLLMIINDILDFSKIEAGHMELDCAPYDIAKLVENCLNLVALPVAQKRIELVCDIDPSLPAEWLGDAARLRQVLVNLVGNAAKFTHSGEIVVRVDRVWLKGDQCSARFQVRDTGIGIPPEQHERIFDVFCQADGSTSRQYGGTGLGLAIASRLVVLMGGQLKLDSEPGKGSSFEFTIVTTVRSTEPLVQPGSLQGKTVRVAEANQSYCNAIHRVLRHAGAQITENQRPSVIIGADVAVDDGPASPPVVRLLPLGSSESARRQASAILRKPVAARDLIRACLAATETTGALVPETGTRNMRPSPSPRRQRTTILLAEDNKINQMLAVKTLEKGGYRLLVANNGIEAVKLAQEPSVDVILMDIQMPEMDGFEATTRIHATRKAGGLEPVPVIAMTAHALKGDRERCLAKGMIDYLSKPVRPAQLLEIVEKYSSERTARL